MDDLKLFSKNEKQMDTLVRTVHVFSTDIGMMFGMKKCEIVTMKRGKVVKKDIKQFFINLSGFYELLC